MKLNKIRKKLKKIAKRFEKKSKAQPDKLAALEEKLLEKKASYQTRLTAELSDRQRESLETKLVVTDAQLKKAKQLSAAFTEVSDE